MAAKVSIFSQLGSAGRKPALSGVLQGPGEGMVLDRESLQYRMVFRQRCRAKGEDDGGCQTLYRLKSLDDRSGIKALNLCTHGRGVQRERGVEKNVSGLYQGNDERARDESWSVSAITG